MNLEEKDVAVMKIKKFLNLRVDTNKEAIDVLKELSTFYPENSSVARRNLKSGIEKRALNFNKEFLQTFKTVYLTLDSIYKDVSAMNITANEMTTRLSATRSKTKSLIEETTHLQTKIENAEKKQCMSSSIIERFQLDASEVAALRAPNVNLEMLSALKRAEEIYDKCNTLECASHGLARDIKDQMKQYQENGSERLFRWAQARCRTIDHPDPTSLLPQVMEKLQVRPQIFNQIMDEYCANRRDLLVRQLISALTRGGRPIEHRVTEPKRYVGDMLAWLHQAVPAEKDSLSYLLRNCDSSDLTEKMQHALCSITEGVCHPLKVRIEHILLGENNARDPLLVQSLLALLRYYMDIVMQVVGEGKLLSTMVELAETAERTLMISLTGRVAVLLGREVDRPSNTSLTLTPGVHNALALLTQVFQIDISTPPALVQKIAGCVIDPIMINITESASNLTPVDAAVYLLNGYQSIVMALALHPFNDDRLERLKAQSDAQMDTLISEQASCLVAHLGLGVIYTSLQAPLAKPLARNPTFDSGILSAFTVKLGKVISNPDMYMMPQLALLSNIICREEILRKAGTVIFSIYSQLYELVYDPENQFQRPETILIHSPDLVRNAFNCERKAVNNADCCTSFD